jgi:predicted metalloprotease with PDZ domain
MLTSLRALALPLALSLAAPAAPALDQDGPPPALPQSPLVPEAKDTPWPGGAMTLEIDASDVTRGVYRAVQTIPVAPSAAPRRVTLLFPQWLPGNHAPRGPIAELADLRFTADGQPVSWMRDPLEVHAFHIELPAGTRELVARFVHTSPLQAADGRITMTADMLNLQWEKMSLYPAGHHVSRIRVRPSVTFPRGWNAAAALDGKTVSGDRASWAETDYETLVDSPVFAGRWFRRWNLGNTITLNAVADGHGLLDIQPENLATIAALGDQALRLFGTAPYDRYEFLVALSDRIGGIGLEHLRSSENQLEQRDFVDWKAFDWDRNVLAHELVHAWNGKYRRPADLTTPDYRQPMQDSLLWVYEGQTQFWGWVLAARSGLQTRETILGTIASAASNFVQQPGRQWRSMGDTVHDPIIAARKPRPYVSLTRDEDYYSEGALIWLEADQVIRRGTSGKKGLDDFARAFFSARGNGQRTATYTFADVVAALNGVYPHDWATFLRARVDQAGRPAPLAGIEAAGYRLVWKDKPNPYDAGRMENGHYLALEHSIGLRIDRDGTVSASRWGSPAFDAGVVKGARLIAVDGTEYSAEQMRLSLTEAANNGRPVELLIVRDRRYRTVTVANGGGLRYPWLEKSGPANRPAPLDLLLSPRK